MTLFRSIFYLDYCVPSRNSIASLYHSRRQFSNSPQRRGASRADLSGVYPPITTPFTDAGNVDYGKLKENFDTWNSIDFAGFHVSLFVWILLSVVKCDGPLVACFFRIRHIAAFFIMLMFMLAWWKMWWRHLYWNTFYEFSNWALFCMRKISNILISFQGTFRFDLDGKDWKRSACTYFIQSVAF